MNAEIFTIGFTAKRAEDFFDLLKAKNVKAVLDVRLNNKSQLSGFAKKDDLKFFLKEIGQIAYVEVTDLAPEADMLKRYQRKEISWEEYADRYLNLITKRNVERLIDKNQVVGSCLLCSEHLPHHCHRRLAAEYLNSQWGSNLKITHLVK
jgi:uncharacterized protein (DUF488 family)